MPAQASIQYPLTPANDTQGDGYWITRSSRAMTKERVKA
jgi:hypothetical protein